MKYDEVLENVSILGAAGKMGSGILFLTAVETADISLLPENRNRQFVINALDVSQKGLSGLMDYLRIQIQKAAEKKIVTLRNLYADRKDLIENGEIIHQYVFDVMNIIRFGTNIEAAYNSNLIFEAVSEDPELKVKLLTSINVNSTKSPWFFTNTSSVPIHEIDEKGELKGRILGFHFYNPPAVQKLVELIVSDKTESKLVNFAAEYAKRLRKKIVPSNDIAGFIGNGHFMRDALYAVGETERLMKDFSYIDSVYIMNRISQEFLIRPMGIFQLIDYVGLDVCRYIMKVMSTRLKDKSLHSTLLDKFISLNIMGGQFPDGSQKEGFFAYEKGRPVSIFDPGRKEYVDLKEIVPKCDEKIGRLPQSAMPWKVLIGSASKEEQLKNYFTELADMTTFGADLAKRYAAKSRQIGLKLVEDSVARNNEDVNTVLLTGFYHAYGPINDYLIWEKL